MHGRRGLLLRRRDCVNTENRKAKNEKRAVVSHQFSVLSSPPPIFTRGAIVEALRHN